MTFISPRLTSTPTVESRDALVKTRKEKRIRRPFSSPPPSTIRRLIEKISRVTDWGQELLEEIYYFFKTMSTPTYTRSRSRICYITALTSANDINLSHALPLDDRWHWGCRSDEMNIKKRRDLLQLKNFLLILL